MINELLYGLEVFLDVYEISWDSNKLQMVGGCHIYRPPSREAVAPTVSKICEPSDEPMPLPGVASVHPVTLRPEVAVELLTHCLQHHRFNR